MQTKKFVEATDMLNRIANSELSLLHQLIITNTIKETIFKDIQADMATSKKIGNTNQVWYPHGFNRILELRYIFNNT